MPKLSGEKPVLSEVRVEGSPKRRSKLKNLARNGRFFLYSGVFGREAYPDRGISLKEPNRRAEFAKVIICVKDYHEPIAGFFIL